MTDRQLSFLLVAVDALLTQSSSAWYQEWEVGAASVRKASRIVQVFRQVRDQ